MDIEYGFICDHADQTGGKLDAIGIGFDAIFAPDVPVIHPHMSIVFRLRYSVAEAGNKVLNIRLIDSDGQPVGQTEGLDMPVELQAPPSGTTGKLNIVGNLNGIEFPQYGDYAFHILVDGHEMHRIGFEVAQPPETQ